MKRSNIFWGIVLLMGAIGIIMSIFTPHMAIFTVPVWKWILAALLLYWMINNVIDGNTLGRKLDIFLPLALGIWLFHDAIENWIGAEFPFWSIIVAGALLHVSVNLIFGGVKLGERSGHSYTEVSDDETVTTKTCKFQDAAVYLDATKTGHSIKNSFGNMTVYFQNADVVNGPEVIEVEVDNAFGNTTIHVPENWSVRNDLDNSLGNITIRKSQATTTRVLHLKGDNRFGQVEIL